MVFSGIVLFPNCELMLPDRLQYFLDDVWNFENVVKIWARIPPNYYKNASKTQEKLWGHLGKILSLYICDSNNIVNFENMEVMCTVFVCCLICVSHFYILFSEDEDRT